MRTKKFLYNSVTAAILQAFTLLVGLIVPRLYLVTYGSAVNGLVSTIVQFVSYFNYVEAGLGSVLIYALFKPLATRDTNEINGIVSVAKKEYIKASGLYFLLVVCLSLVYPFMINIDSIDVKTVILLVLVIGTFGALDFYTMAKYQVLLISDQKEYAISLISLLALLVNFIVTILLIKNNVYIVLVRLVPMLSFVIRSWLLHMYVSHRYPFIKYNQPSINLRLTRRWDALILQISTSINLSVPVVIIAISCSLKMASVYSVYSMVFAGLIGIISVFTAGVSASFGNLVAEKEFDLLTRAHTQFEFSIYGITAFLYSCTLILINPFVSIYTSGVRDISYVHPIYGILFVIWGILFNVRIPYTALVNAAGLYRETRKINLLQVVLLVVLAIILVQLLGITGVLLAQIIAMLYWEINLILVIKHLVIEEPLKRTFLRIIRMFIVVGLSNIPFLLGIQVTASSLYEWFLWAMGVAVWCGIVTLLSNYMFDRKVFINTAFRLKIMIPRSIA
ncbi:MAG: hypothetical protein P4L59_18590 [Desulfosporosinus sp.]|nr:hypothetical protein [Desulfosporosinus sp.]